jgi:Protein of unknown function (DUF664)
MLRMSEHHHGEKHAVHLALVQRLRVQAAEVKRLAAGLDETTLATRSVPEKWSMKELICHVRRMETIFGERLHRMLTEEATIVPYESPDGDEAFLALTKRPTAEVLDEYLTEATRSAATSKDSRPPNGIARQNTRSSRITICTSRWNTWPTTKRTIFISCFSVAYLSGNCRTRQG